jgi:hypothetical protein
LYLFVVVKANVIINDLVRLLESWIADLPQRFFFEMPEEAFHRSVVPTIAASGHGGSDSILPGKDKIRL